MKAWQLKVIIDGVVEKNPDTEFFLFKGDDRVEPELWKAVIPVGLVPGECPKPEQLADAVQISYGAPLPEKVLTKEIIEMTAADGSKHSIEGLPEIKDADTTGK